MRSLLPGVGPGKALARVLPSENRPEPFLERRDRFLAGREKARGFVIFDLHVLAHQQVCEFSGGAVGGRLGAAIFREDQHMTAENADGLRHAGCGRHFHRNDSRSKTTASFTNCPNLSGPARPT